MEGLTPDARCATIDLLNSPGLTSPGFLIAREGQLRPHEPYVSVALPVDWPSLIREVLAEWVVGMPPVGTPYLGGYAHHASNRNCAGVEIEFNVLKVDEQHADITYRVWAYRPWPGECA